jgi:hypothetical protein
VENIVNFPTKLVKDWTSIERPMRFELSKIGIPAGQVQERIVGIMHEFYELLSDIDISCKLDIGLPVPPDAGAAIREEIGARISALQHERLQAYKHKLFMERLDREIVACRELGLW